MFHQCLMIVYHVKSRPKVEKEKQTTQNVPKPTAYCSLAWDWPVPSKISRSQQIVQTETDWKCFRPKLNSADASENPRTSRLSHPDAAPGHKAKSQNTGDHRNKAQAELADFNLRNNSQKTLAEQPTVDPSLISRSALFCSHGLTDCRHGAALLIYCHLYLQLEHCNHIESFVSQTNGLIYTDLSCTRSHTHLHQNYFRPRGH